MGYTFYDRANWYPEDVKNSVFSGYGLKYTINDVDLCAEITKTIVEGDYIDNNDGYVGGMVGCVYSLDNISIDLSYNTIAFSKDYIYALGTTIAFDFF